MSKSGVGLVKREWASGMVSQRSEVILIFLYFGKDGG